MSTIGIRGGGYLPPTTQSPVQQVPTNPTPGPGPVPAPVPQPPNEPGPPSPPPSTPHPPNQGPNCPGMPPTPPTLPPTQGPGHPPIPGPGHPPTQGPGHPPTLPPNGPGMPPPTGPVEPPTDPTVPPTDPTDPPPAGDGFNWKPWLIGAGVVGAGVLGALAIRSGVKNVQSLQATERAFASGTMHQGGLQAISDARLGATFANGIGFGEYAAVALPGINRVGLGGRLTAVANGHVQHNQLLAASTALRHAAGAADGVLVHEPLRRSVFADLQAGRGMQAILDDLDRSAAGARPVFDNPQLARYSRQASIVELGARAGSDHVSSAVRVNVPQLRLDGRELVETGSQASINQIVTGRGSSLGTKGLASGIGSVQAANVSTLPPALRERAIAASKVDPKLVETIGLRPAYVERWSERLLAGAAS